MKRQSTVLIKFGFYSSNIYRSSSSIQRYRIVVKFIVKFVKFEKVVKFVEKLMGYVAKKAQSCLTMYNKIKSQIPLYFSSIQEFFIIFYKRTCYLAKIQVYNTTKICYQPYRYFFSQVFNYNSTTILLDLCLLPYNH